MAVELTPMMQQYQLTKTQHPDEILFFRLGDFYEMFFDDAIMVSKELGLTLTSRGSDASKAPMCGIPYHAAETYINKLINNGHKIAIAEQIGNPKAPGLTKREVIKIITPGTVLSDSVLTATQNNYVALVLAEENELVLSCADVSTGECFYGVYQGQYRQQQLLDELYRLTVAELLLSGSVNIRPAVDEFLKLRLPKCLITVYDKEDNEELLQQHFGNTEFSADNLVKKAVARLLSYLHEVVKSNLCNLNRITCLDVGEQLILDNYTLRNLEITHNLRDGGKKHTLYDVLDFTKTAMGGRMLKHWLEHPLLSVVQINRRLEAVDELYHDFALKDRLREQCGSIYDFERLITRIEIGNANARDMVALRQSFFALPKLKKVLQETKSAALCACCDGIDTYDELAELLMRAIVDEPGLTIRDGNIIKEGFNAELDEYRRLAHNSKQMLQEIEERERAATGIKALKISYNKVFGYYLEVRNSSSALVPAHYIRKQTLANAERYITEELKEFETKILGAQEKIVNLEYSIFNELREQVATNLISIQHTAHAVAELDALCSLAEAAVEYNYVRPSIRTDGKLVIHDGRHPLIERMKSIDIFVPNDTELNHSDHEILLITGPNMAGKSTYMRQTAILTLMAQVGSFIPARDAAISPVDRIFTRIGASDDLISGQSTFMVEMNEVAQILQHATKNSLIILDEIGRGTSTFDGMSIARAVVEYIKNKIHAKTLFATHYHELTDLEDDLIKNYSVAVKEKGNQVVFLRRIIAGGADKSYGIHVARLAGLPKSVLQNAEQYLKCLEESSAAQEIGKSAIKNKNDAAQAQTGMDSLFKSSLSDELLSLDIMTMTPIEALNNLYKLQNQAKQEAGILS